MDIQVTRQDPIQSATQCLLVPVYEDGTRDPFTQRLDEVADGGLSEILARGDIEGKVGETMMLNYLPGVQAKRVMLLGFGKPAELRDQSFRKAVAAAVSALKGTGVEDAVWALAEVKVGERDSDWILGQVAELIDTGVYRFDQFKSEPAKPGKWQTTTLALAGEADTDAAAASVRTGQAVAAGMNKTRDLANTPGNVCTPSYLAQQAKELAKSHKALDVKVLDEKDMEKLGMGAFLGVSQGSQEPGKFIVMEYRGAAKERKPHVLVGKGITFDSGGISIKPAANMDEMKYDMGGAASVFGALTSVLEANAEVNVVAVVAAAENMPSGSAIRPGDILTSMSGKTVEIINTDAEGRLVLCDALSYVKDYEPASVVDVATLTGACIIALGKEASALYSNDQGLADELLQASRYSSDRAWQMPLWDEYQELLESPFADMANVGGRQAGSITAACFLSRFAGEYRWAHLDIAGTAWQSGDKKGATGRPVALLSRYLLQKAEAGA